MAARKSAILIKGNPQPSDALTAVPCYPVPEGQGLALIIRTHRDQPHDFSDVE